MICILGGTAAYHLTPTEFGEYETLPPLDTPFGPAPVFLRLNRGVLFSSRHGANKLSRSAAFVNHRANLWAAKEYGATAILSWNGVGAINPTLRVGDMLVPDDLIDATRARSLPSPVGAILTGEGQGVGVRGIFSETHRTALLTAVKDTASPDGAVRRERRPGGIGANLTVRSALRSGSGVAQNARDGTPLRFVLDDERVPDDERLKFAHMGSRGVWESGYGVADGTGVPAAALSAMAQMFSFSCIILATIGSSGAKAEICWNSGRARTQCGFSGVERAASTEL